MHGPETASVGSFGRPQRWARPALLALLGCMAVLTLWSPAGAGAALPPQGVYEQCAPATQDCAPRLKAIADAGFQYVLNYTAWFGSAEQVRDYADEAQAVGLKVIWPLNDHAWRDGTDLRSYYRYLGPDCPCSTNAQFKQWALGLVKDHPATWGFYVGDELSPTSQNISQTTALEREVKSIAPGKPTMYVTIPNDNGVLTTQLAPFASVADYVGADYYPIGKANSMDGVTDYASETRQMTANAGSRPIFVLQAFSWDSYDPSMADRFPTRSEMQQMRDMAIGAGDPQILLWYAFNDVMRSSNPTQNWENVKAAAFAPYVRVSGVSPRRCVKRLKARVSVRANAAIRKVRAKLDGRAVLKTTREHARVPAPRLAGGRHVLRVTAADRQGKVSKQSLRFRICPRMA
ncbi:MAG TPA: hypothetical protein VLB79_08980 [Solirubrobacterales bacterium]|nr:hypothetical protein [Solirubrobacterales bacterium]